MLCLKMLFTPDAWKDAVRGRFYRPVKQAVSMRLDGGRPGLSQSFEIRRVYGAAEAAPLQYRIKG
jgi:hypothetical protein